MGLPRPLHLASPSCWFTSTLPPPQIAILTFFLVSFLSLINNIHSRFALSSPAWHPIVFFCYTGVGHPGRTGSGHRLQARAPSDRLFRVLLNRKRRSAGVVLHYTTSQCVEKANQTPLGVNHSLRWERLIGIAHLQKPVWAKWETMKSSSLLILLLPSKLYMALAQNCVPLANSTQCPAFNASSISTGSDLAAL